jgi:P-type conjugative transfer protein TrbJ
MKTRKRTRAIIATVTCMLLLFALPATVGATIPVYDYINWALSFIQRYQQIANQYEQIRKAEAQVKALTKQLESFGEGEWSSASGILIQLDSLLATGEQLSYLNGSVGSLFEETFPGYEAPASWPDEYRLRVLRTRTTLRQALRALNALSEAGRDTGWIELLQHRADQADSPLEEIEVSNMYANYALTESQRAMAASLLTANAIAVAQAHEIQVKASADAARSAWLVRDDVPLPGWDPSHGYTGLPQGF